MKKYNWIVLFLAITGIVMLTGCGKTGYEYEESVDKGEEKEGQEETALQLREPTIVINEIGYYDWTVYTIGESQSPAEGYRNEVVVSSSSDPKSFNPVIANETSSSIAMAWVFEGLTDVDPITQEVKPLLAESWEIGEDGLTYTFHIRKGVRFSDGKPMTMEDILFSFNDVYFNEDVPGVGMRDLLKVKGRLPKVEAVDDYTLRITTPDKYAPFLRHVGGVTILPKHILNESIEKKELSSTWNVATDPQEIIGTGPYRITSYKNGQMLVQEPNPYYWLKGKPDIGKRIVLIVPNINSAKLKFDDGEIDSFGTRGQDYAGFVEAAAANDFSLYDCGGSSGTEYLIFNQNTIGVPEQMQVWFRDRNFRKAVAHAIDKKRIIEEVYRGMAEPLIAAEPSSNPLFHNPRVKTYEYDLEKSKEILTGAGYIDYDGDGIIEKPKGVPVKFILTTNANNEQRVDTCQKIALSLNELGMDVIYRGLDFNNLVTKLTTSLDWEAMVLGLTGGVEPHGGFNVWKINGRTHMFNQRPLKPSESSKHAEWERNAGKWEKGVREWERDIQALFEKAVRELDYPKRKKLYDKWQEIVAEELPFIYLITEKSIPAVRNKFENLKPCIYGGSFHNLDGELKIVP